MAPTPFPRRLTAAVGLGLSAALALSACGGDDSGSSEEGGDVSLSFLVDNAETTVQSAEGVIAAFEDANPGITIEVETRPQGGEGDNIVKTRLATGDMTDVFAYNSGSLLAALSPEQSLVPVTDQEWVGALDDSFVQSRLGGRPGVRCPRRHLDGWRGPLQQGGLRRARPRGPHHVGRVHGEQRDDRRGREDARDPDLRHDVDLAAVRPG